jgi:hypothetical protein
MVSKYTRVTLTGTINSSGAVDVYTDKIVRGNIKAVHIDYPAATVAVKITTDELVAQDIVDLGAANTDRIIYPKTPAQTKAGVDINNSYDNAAITKLYTDFVVFSRLRLVCASGTVAQIVKVNIIYEEY